jgi:hypothetical protein
MRGELVRYLLIACEVLAREAYLCAAHSPHIIDIQLLDKGLHDTPETLRREIQARIDGADGRYDAVLLGYGLCSNSTAGILAREALLVMPRAHDCITLYLGSRARYEAEFFAHPGTYYYTSDYLERIDGGSSVALGAVSDEERRKTYDEYVEKSGRDNADYLMEVMGAWASNYSRAAFIEMGVGPSDGAECRARKEAERKDWIFERLRGDLILMHKLVDGEWDEDFLVVRPGERITAAYESQIVGTSGADG